jgi:signal transduction histidine kinase
MLFVSSGSTELTGYTPEELVNNKITSYGKLIVDKDLDLVSKAIQESNQKHGHFEMIYRIKTKSEKIKYVWERGIEINTNSPDDHILEGFITDITAHILDKQNLEKERKAAETLADEAQKANRAKSQFLANISHEIRTPLNGIIGFSTLLHDSKLEDTQQEYAEYVYASGKRLLEIVNNILDFSKITDNNITFHERKVDIKSNLHKTALILSDQIQKKNLEYHIFIDETLPELISIDALKLNQTIMNLLGNALKFTEKGSIEFHAEFLNQKDLYIYVRDTGIGISEENQKLIFDYFTQADGSLTRKYGGTGIGLTLSKQIIEKMGGTLQVKSKIGEGSTFYFKIPIHELECDAYD